MYNSGKFIAGMAAGMAVGTALGAFSRSRQAKIMCRKFSRSPVGRTIRSIGDVINNIM